MPGEDNCTQCHGGNATSSAENLKISLVNATGYVPGQEMIVRIVLSDATARRWGFQLTVRDAADPANKQVGTFRRTDTANTKVTNAAGGAFQYISHTTAGTRNGATGSSTWEVAWTPPADFSGEATFYAAGNAANGDGTENGDKIYVSTLTVRKEAAAPPPTVTRFLPRLVFGNGWYTALYLFNTASTGASVKVAFIGDDGAALASAPGGGSQELILKARGSARLELQDGPLTQGYASVVVPEGVTGYAVLRQTPPDQGPRETFLPLSAGNVQTSTLVWDDTSLTTLLSIANPGDAEAAVTVSLRDPDGQPVASSTVAVPAKGRVEFNLKDRPEFTMVTGSRGTVEISVATGNIAVAAFRLGAQSFTAIPSADK
ncbi:MAG: hypothetical protein HY858_13415 [Candidatus Solibacter usitatus]|nr:hypothetical protein [Candidatus Solibacter usitatus]